MNTEDFPVALTQELTRLCGTGVLVLDRAGQVVWANPALAAMLGVTAAELRGGSASRLPREDLALLFGRQELIEVTDAAGARRWLARSVHEVQTVGSEAVQIQLFEDHTQLRRLQAENQRLREENQSLSLADPLTGLLSQRALLLLLEPQVARTRRYHNPLALVLLNVAFELDGASDVRAVAQLLKDQLRWADLIGRDDNGDFVIILPETQREAAAILADKVRALLHNLPGVASVRTGVVDWQKGDSAAGMLRRARDAALPAAALAGLG